MDDLGSCYFVLGVDPDANPDQIKEAWRDLVQVWHPDRFGGNDRLQQKAEERLKEINLAYERLRTYRDAEAARATSGGSAATAVYDPPNGDDPEIDPLEVLRQGVNVWNLWRKKYSNLRPNLQSANLNGMCLEGIDLRDTDLSSAALQDCDLYKANLSAANAAAARLQRADLSRSLLVSANLRLADLTETDLSGANLSGAILNRCKLTGTNLIATNLSGADLSEASGLTAQQMAYTVTDQQTKLPAYL
jgi:uncharacterized protein YjbI with pentapeptide repeats